MGGVVIGRIRHGKGGVEPAKIDQGIPRRITRNRGSYEGRTEGQQNTTGRLLIIDT